MFERIDKILDRRQAEFLALRNKKRQEKIDLEVLKAKTSFYIQKQEIKNRTSNGN